MIMNTSNNDQVKNLIQIRKSLARNKNGALSQNKAFLDFLKIQAELTAEIDATWATVRSTMDAYDIQKMDGDWGSIQFVPYPTYKAAGKVAPRFFKQVLDGEEIKHYMKKHAGKTPAGIKLTISQRFRKDIKKGI